MSIRDRVARLMAESSLLVLPSHGEPFGLAILEAMASGLPVVAVDEGGPRTLVQHGRGGYLVPRQNPDALAEALTALLSRPDAARQMGAFNRGLVEERFTWERVLDRLQEVYAEAVGRASVGFEATRGGG